MGKTISHEDTNENLMTMIGENLTPDGKFIVDISISVTWFASHERHHKKSITTFEYNSYIF